MNQTLLPSEIILVDDASKRETALVLDEISKQYPLTISVVTLVVNGGPATARNKGWASARFPYVAFLDADDTWHRLKLEIQYRWMESNPDIVMCGHKDQIVLMTPSTFESDDRSPGNALRIKKHQQMFSNHFSTRTVMIKTDTAFRFEAGLRYAEDYLLWSKLVLNGSPCVVLSSCLAESYKPAFGSNGLTGHLWPMQHGVMNVFRQLRNDALLSLPEFLIYSGWSMIKFLRRLCIVKFRGLLREIQ